MDKNTAIDKKKNKRVLEYVLVWGCLAAVIILIAIWMGVRRIPKVSLEDYITTDLVALDGRTEHSDSNLFRLPKKGEKLVFTVTLPDEAKSIDHPVLCFFNYNSVITIYQNGEEIYAHGQDKLKEGIPTGHTIVRSALADSTEPVTIEFLQQEDNTLSDFTEVYLMPAEYAWLYPVHTIPLQVSLALLIIFAIFSMMVFAFNTVLYRIGASIQGFMLSLFCISITIWALGYTGTLFVITNDDVMAPYLEYTSTYLMPAFFTAYMMTGMGSYGWRKKVCIFLEVMYTGLFLIATMLQVFSPTHDGYLILLNTLYAFFAVGGIFFVFLIFHNRTSAGKVIRVGMIITLALAMIEIAAAAIGRSRNAADSIGLRFTTQAVTPTIVLIFQSALIVDYMSRVYKAYLERKEMDRLEEIAYTDALTGLENRTAFDEKVYHELEEKKGYAIAFIDADGLKAANDRFGHKAGDRLLRQVGDAIRKGCEYSDCRAFRYGGDEFLIIGTDEEGVRNAIARMEEELVREKDSKIESMTASFGIAVHTEETEGSVADVIREADIAMYRQKKEKHKRRKDLAKR
ncbi:MAG: GGDEF domain-containing protein [Eubacterium sp.]|nr:GGDEF domain-containing protein [Eubacterium sp.]